MQPFVVLALVTAQRLGELVLAEYNTHRLRAQGAVETGADHYVFIVLLHGAWLLGLWAFAWDRPVNLALLAVFVLLQAGRVWVIATLGSRWTTRIITLPGAPLVTRGPYRFVSHPNYVVVALDRGPAAGLRTGRLCDHIQPSQRSDDVGGLWLKRSRVMDRWRIEVVGGRTDRDALVASGCFVEIIAFTPRVFVPVDRPTVLEAVLRRHPVQTVLDGQAA